ncbi:MAG: CpXC domain-containing protein [Lentisphaeria bacterium]
MPELENDNAPGQQAECPKCQQRHGVKPVTVITPDSDELEQLFQGTLNQVQCPECNTKFILQAPVVFRDDDKQKLIYYIPVEQRDQWQEAEKEMIKVTHSTFGSEEGVPIPDCRLTLTRRSFIEKIAIHSAGRDDRVIEYIKYQLYNKPEGDIDPVRVELLYDFSNESENNIQFILFDRETGAPSAATNVPAELYDELVETFLKDEDMQEELEALFSGHFVNVEKLLGIC